MPAGGDSVVASLAAPVVGQPLEGTKGVKIDGEKKKTKNQKGVEEVEVTDMPVASKKHKAEEVKENGDAYVTLSAVVSDDDAIKSLNKKDKKKRRKMLKESRLEVTFGKGTSQLLNCCSQCCVSY